MGDFLLNLFDTSDFPARWHCGDWTAGHGWLHIVSDIAIFLAYAAIPLTIAYFVLRRRDVPFPRIFWLFAAFIFSCGSVHLVEALIFWEPVYRLSGVMKLGTAVVSWCTVVALVRTMPLAMSLPGLKKMNSDLEEANAKLEESNRRLQDEIAERAAIEAQLRDNQAELESTLEALKVKNQELADFTYMASHDLQEPLRKLMSFSELLKEDAGDALNEDAREDLDFIVDAAERMKALVHSLLRLSRVGRAQLELADVPIAEVAREAVGNLTTTIEDSGAEVVVPDALPTIRADHELLVQLFQNLIGNGIKFVAPGTVPRVEITAEEVADGWLIGVADNGIGIAPENVEQIFTPFRRLHTRTEYAGSGIGLSICKKIVERHGGVIRVESTPGEGAHFLFLLGVTDPAPISGVA